MTSRRLLVLGALAVLAIVGGLWLASRQTSNSSGQAHAALYPDLKRQLDAVTAVRIFTAGDQRAVELVHADSGWTVSERNGHAADEAKLRKLLISLADAEIYEEKTSNPQHYASLGVEDITASGAGSVRIELAGTPQPTNLLVGKQGAGGETTYVRRVGDKPSWLVDVSIDTSSSPDAWLRKEILNIAADRVQSATVTAKGAKSYTLAKQARTDASFSAEGLPKGKSLSSPSAADVVATSLIGLTMADVQPASAFAATPATEHAIFKTFDGLVVEVDGWTREDKHFIAVKTSFDPAQAERFKVAVAPPADAAAAAPPAGEGQATAEPAKEPAQAAKAAEATEVAPPATPKVEDEAKQAAARLNGWVYEVPDYKYQGLFKPVDELL